MTYASIDAAWWPYLFILLAGWLPTEMWRWAGVWFSGSIDEESEILVFIRALATALVAAVIARLILFPTGNLADLPVWLRAGSAAIGFFAFLSAGRRPIYGIVTAEILLLSGGAMI